MTQMPGDRYAAAMASPFSDSAPIEESGASRRADMSSSAATFTGSVSHAVEDSIQQNAGNILEDVELIEGPNSVSDRKCTPRGSSTSETDPQSFASVAAPLSTGGSARVSQDSRHGAVKSTGSRVKPEISVAYGQQASQIMYDSDEEENYYAHLSAEHVNSGYFSTARSRACGRQFHKFCCCLQAFCLPMQIITRKIKSRNITAGMAKCLFKVADFVVGVDGGNVGTVGNFGGFVGGGGFVGRFADATDEEMTPSHEAAAGGGDVAAAQNEAGREHGTTRFGNIYVFRGKYFIGPHWMFSIFMGGFIVMAGYIFTNVVLIPNHFPWYHYILILLLAVSTEVCFLRCSLANPGLFRQCEGLIHDCSPCFKTSSPHVHLKPFFGERFDSSVALLRYSATGNI